MPEVGIPYNEYQPPLVPIRDVIAVHPSTKVVVHHGSQGDAFGGTCWHPREDLVEGPVKGIWLTHFKLLRGVGNLMMFSAMNHSAQRGEVTLTHYMGGLPYGFEAIELPQAKWAAEHHYIGGHPAPERYQWVPLQYRPIALFPGDGWSVVWRDLEPGDNLRVDWVLVQMAGLPQPHRGPQAQIFVPPPGAKFTRPLPVQ